jgi:hypothetical protein
MQANLKAQLPDGRQALLRIQDPRVLHGLLAVLSAAQRQQFCGPVLEWHVLLDGQRHIIESATHAQAQ